MSFGGWVMMIAAATATHYCNKALVRPEERKRAEEMREREATIRDFSEEMRKIVEQTRQIEAMVREYTCAEHSRAFRDCINSNDQGRTKCELFHQLLVNCRANS